MQAQRDFIERHGIVWSARAAERRRSGRVIDLAIADALDRIVAGMRAELAALPVSPILAEPEPKPAIAAATTWASPVFNVAGRFNPFAGSYAEQMLASAATCEQLGYPGIAASYRTHAERGHPPGDVGEAPTQPRSRPTWSGPNITPPEPAPFSAGPQLGLFA